MPYLGSTVFVTMAVIALLVGLLAMLLLARAVFSHRVLRAERALSARPRSSLLVGLLAWILLGALSAASLKHPGVRPLGLLLTASLLAALCVGLSAVATRLGARLGGLEQPSSEGALTTFQGGVVALLACLVPLVGWFLVLPALLASAAGAVTLSLFGVGAERPLAERPLPARSAMVAQPVAGGFPYPVTAPPARSAT